MAYQILTTTIFLASVLGVIILVSRRLPQALEKGEEAMADSGSNLTDKGLPIASVSGFTTFSRVWLRKVLHFILEAKDIRHPAKITYKMKQLFRIPLGTNASPVQKELAQYDAIKNEKYYLDQIKRNPKDLIHYSSLGKYYLGEKNYTEAVSVYEYLITHEPSEGNHYAQLGYITLNLEDYESAVKHYEKAVSLDASHPNRYYNLSLSYSAQGKWLKAGEALRKALELEPSNIKYLKFLSEIYLKTGDKLAFNKVNRLLKSNDPITPKVQPKNIVKQADVASARSGQAVGDTTHLS